MPMAKDPKYRDYVYDFTGQNGLKYEDVSFTDEDKKPSGGYVEGVGIQIDWQRGRWEATKRTARLLRMLSWRR